MKYNTKKDIDTYINLITRYTGINRKYFDDALERDGIINIIKHPDTLNLTPADREKYDEFLNTANLYKRLCHIDDFNKIILKNPEAAVDYLRTLSNNTNSKEEAHILLLNARKELIAEKTISTGTIDEVYVAARDIVKEALKYDAHGVIFAHNHPSGSARVSAEDFEVTEKIGNALETVGIKFIDSIVYTDTKYESTMAMRINGKKNNLLTEPYVGYKKSILPTLSDLEKKEYELIKATYERNIQDVRIGGDSFMSLKRFNENTQHMIVFDVLDPTYDAGEAGERKRVFLPDAGYAEALISQGKNEMRILCHANVKDGDLIYDAELESEFESDGDYEY